MRNANSRRRCRDGQHRQATQGSPAGEVHRRRNRAYLCDSSHGRLPLSFELGVVRWCKHRAAPPSPKATAGYARSANLTRCARLRLRAASGHIAMLPSNSKPKKLPTPPARKSWDIRPLQPEGSPTEDDVYLAVGRALTAWERIEVQLSELYLFFIGRHYSYPNEYRRTVTASLRAYGSVNGFITRFEMIEKAGDIFFHPRQFGPLQNRELDLKLIEQEKKLQSRFSTIVEETRGFVARRNEIAHGIVGGVRTSPIPSSPQTYFLSPPYYNSRKYPRGRDEKSRTIFETATYHYTAEDVDYYRNQFCELRKKILEFLRYGERVLSADRARETERADRRRPRS